MSEDVDDTMRTGNYSSSNTSINSSLYETPLNSPCKSLTGSPTIVSSLASTDITLDGLSFDTTDYPYETLNGLSDCSGFLRASSADSSRTLVEVNKDSLPKNTNPFVDSPSTQRIGLKKSFLKIVQHLEQINLELIKIDLFENQLEDMSSQIKLFRSNLTQHAATSIDLIEKLVSDINLVNTSKLNQKCSDAQTQTNEKVIFKNDFYLKQELKLRSIRNNLNVSEYSSTGESELSLTEIDISLTEENPFKLTNELKYKLRNLPALVKGYLTRRLMKTNKVMHLKRTIFDTSLILLNFKSNLFRDGKLIVNEHDIFLHQRLCVQLEKACKEFYAVFFITPICKQMDIISKHRHYLNHVKYLSDRRSSSVLSSSQSSDRSKQWVKCRVK